jgi:hypothetical protein
MRPTSSARSRGLAARATALVEHELGARAGGECVGSGIRPDYRKIYMPVNITNLATQIHIRAGTQYP